LSPIKHNQRPVTTKIIHSRGLLALQKSFQKVATANPISGTEKFSGELQLKNPLVEAKICINKLQPREPLVGATFFMIININLIIFEPP